MRGRLARLGIGLALVAQATVVAAGSPGPFAALGLVPLDSGIRAPAFVLPDVDGRPVRLSAPPHAATVLVFWSTW